MGVVVHHHPTVGYTIGSTKWFPMQTADCDAVTPRAQKSYGGSSFSLLSISFKHFHNPIKRIIAWCWRMNCYMVLGYGPEGIVAWCWTWNCPTVLLVGMKLLSGHGAWGPHPSTAVKFTNGNILWTWPANTCRETNKK